MGEDDDMQILHSDDALDSLPPRKVRTMETVELPDKRERRVHFLGNGSASRAACGRLILAWRNDAPRWTPDLTQVTCRACTKVAQ